MLHYDPILKLSVYSEQDADYDYLCWAVIRKLNAACDAASNYGTTDKYTVQRWR